MAWVDSRSLALAVVLMFAGASVTVGLLEEAGAVTLQVSSQGDDTTFVAGEGEVTFTVEVDIPGDQRLPIASVRAEIVADGKVEAEAPCVDPIPEGCQDIEAEIPRIEFNGSTPGDLPNHGYGACGYGYDEVGCLVEDGGYGYKLTNLTHGYGYADGDLTLSFEVTVDTDELDGGNYLFGFVTDTGSDTLGELEAPFQSFTVAEELSAGDTLPTSDDGPTDEDGRVTVSVTDTKTETVSQVDLVVEDGCDVCRFEINEIATVDEVDADDETAPEMPDDPVQDGEQIPYVLDMDLVNETGVDRSDTLTEATINFTLTQDQLDGADPGDVVLRHFADGEFREDLDPTITSALDADPVTFEATATSFSAFAPIVPSSDDGGGTPGGGGGGGGGGDDGADGALATVEAGDTFEADAEPVRVDGFADTAVEEVLLVFGGACTDCSLDATPREGLPEALPAPPGYADTLASFDLDLDAGAGTAALDEAWVNVSVNVPSGHSSQALTILRGTSQGWQPAGPTDVHIAGDAFVNASVPGFSPFLVAPDEAPPTILSIESGEGDQVTPRPTITVEAQDNRGIDVDASSVTIRHNELELERADPSEGCVASSCQLVATYQGDPLFVGAAETTVRLVDDSGLATETTRDYSVDIGPSTVCVQGSPAPSEVVATPSPVILADHSACGLEAPEVSMTVDGEPVQPTLDDQRARYQHPDGFDEGRVSVEVTFTTDEGREVPRAWSFLVDLTPPDVFGTSPEDGATLDTSRPTIEANIDDAVSRIDPRTVTLTLDGEPVEATVEDGRVSFTPDEDLEDGEHEVELTVEDRGGNTQTQSWSFETDTALPAWIFVVVFAAALVALGGAGYVAYQRRLPGFDES